MRVRVKIWVVTAVMGMLTVAGCLTPPAAEMARPADTDLMAQARRHLDEGRHNEALLVVAEQARRDPAAPGLESLRREILDEMTTRRARQIEATQPAHRARMDLDPAEAARVPDTYGQRRYEKPAPVQHAPPVNQAEAMLRLPVSLTLEGADLSALILGLTQSAGPGRAINIIADDSLGGGRTMTMAVTNVPLREVLDYAARNLDVSFYIGEKMIWVTRRTEAADAIPLETRLFRLRKGAAALAHLEPTAMASTVGGAPAAGGGGTLARKPIQDFGLMDAIEKFVPQTAGADMLFDRDAHVLIVKNTRDNLRLIEGLVEALDVTPPQVLIEARFITTSLSDLRELGVNWTVSDLYFKKDGTTRATLGGVGFTPGMVGDMTTGDTAKPTPTLSGSFAYQGVLTSPMFEVMLQALEQSGKAQTLSVPRVTTLNNQPAKIWEGREFRYFERFTTVDVVTSVTDNRENRASRLVPTGQPSKEELGYKLEVTPSVGADRETILLSLAPEISDLAEWVYYESADVDTSVNNRATNTVGMVKLPIFIKRQIMTKVAVRSGETVVMGGLINSTEQMDQRRVPLLGSIPLLGALFRYDVKSKTQRNLLIFVTARILAETGEELVPLEVASIGERGP